MFRNLPLMALRLGLASLSLGVVWLILLLLVRGGDMADLLRAGLSDSAAIARLTGQGLARSGVIYATVITFSLELALAVILIVAGVGFLRLWPSARWVALFGCIGTIALEGSSTLVYLFCLTPSGAAVKLGPVVVNGLVVLGAIVLWGALFLPEPAAPAPQPPGEPAQGAAQG